MSTPSLDYQRREGIHRVLPADAEQVQQVYWQSYCYAFWNESHDQHLQNNYVLSQQIMQESDEIWGWYVHNQLVSLLVLEFPSPDVCVLGRLYTLPEHMRQGYGRQLTQFTETYARQRGAQTVKLWVWHANAAAVRLYEQQGYECIDIRSDKGWTADPTVSGQMIVMAKNLGATQQI